MNSIRRPQLTEIVKAVPSPVANEWLFNPSDILNSPRKVRGKFHTPKVDKDNEYIEKTAVQTAVPDFMHLPILHDFHKERTVGIVTRVVELSDGSFDFEGLIKATDDCNDIWELIAKGEYNQVSIYGKRTCGSAACSVRPEQRMEPCVTTGVRLDSISVCDENARNDGTSLMVAKGSKVVFNATEELIKAETTDSTLMHTVTDYPRKFGSDGLPRTKKKCTATCPQYERNDLGKGDVMDVTAESAEGKLDTLISLVEKLVQKDITEKGTPYDNNYSNKYPDVGSAPESADQGRELPPEESREYGLPEEEKAGNYQMGSQRAASKLDMAAVAMQGKTKAADPDDDITNYAAKFHLKKKAEGEKQKESFVNRDEATKPASAEVPGEEKAAQQGYGTATYSDLKPHSTTAAIPNPDEKRPDEFLDQVAERRADKEAMVERQVGQDSERTKRSVPKQEPTKPSFSNQEHSSRSQTPTEDSAERVKNVAPSGAKEFSGLPYKTEGDAKHSQYPQGGTKKPNPDKTPIPRSGERTGDQAKHTSPPWSEIGGEPKGTERSKPIDRPTPEPKVGSYESNAAPADRAKERMVEGKFTSKKEEVKPGPVTDKERYGKWSSSPGERQHNDATKEPRFVQEEKSDGPVDVEEAQILNEGEDKNEMPDIDSRIDRLIQVISHLVQSDEQVHNKMEEKADDSIGGRFGVREYHSHDGNDQVPQAVKNFQQRKPQSEEEKCKVCKGTEEMKDEDVDLLVKAKVAAEVEIISKAYQVQVDELKARLDKMEKETIEKSGVVVVMREGDESVGTPYLTNAAAVAAAKKAKVA